MIRNPNFFAVGPYRDSHRVDPDVDSLDDGSTIGIDHVDGVGRRVRNEDQAARQRDRRGLRTEELGVADGCSRFGSVRLWNSLYETEITHCRARRRPTVAKKAAGSKQGGNHHIRQNDHGSFHR